MKRYVWVAAAVVLIDQAVKLLARNLIGMAERIILVPGVLAFTYAENTGMAFSMFSGQTWLLAIVSLAVIFGGLLVVRRYQLSAWSRIAVMLMLGGAVGNVIDRLLQGYVVDMFEVLLFEFAVFNVADAALTIGCAMTFYALLLRRDDWREKTHG